MSIIYVISWVSFSNSVLLSARSFRSIKFIILECWILYIIVKNGLNWGRFVHYYFNPYLWKLSWFKICDWFKICAVVYAIFKKETYFALSLFDFGLSFWELEKVLFLQASEFISYNKNKYIYFLLLWWSFWILGMCWDARIKTHYIKQWIQFFPSSFCLTLIRCLWSLTKIVIIFFCF